MNNKKGNTTNNLINLGIIIGVGLIIFLVITLALINISQIIITNDMKDYCIDNGYEYVENEKFNNNFVCVGTKKIPNEIGYETIRSNIIKYEDIKDGR